MWIRLNDIIIDSANLQLIERNDSRVVMTKTDGTKLAVMYSSETAALDACSEIYERLKEEDSEKMLKRHQERMMERSVKELINDRRTLNTLGKLGVENVNGLTELTEEQLLSIPYSGKHVVNTVCMALQRVGMKLKAS